MQAGYASMQHTDMMPRPWQQAAACTDNGCYKGCTWGLLRPFWVRAEAVVFMAESSTSLAWLEATVLARASARVWLGMAWASFSLGGGRLVLFRCCCCCPPGRGDRTDMNRSPSPCQHHSGQPGKQGSAQTPAVAPEQGRGAAFWVD